MKKGWRVVIVIVLICLLLGGVCIGVGLMTGADMERIYSVLDARYHITEYYEYTLQVIDILMAEL